MNNLSVKKGDKVVILAGKDNGKTGKILAVTPKTNKVIVEGLNIVKKHQKARTSNEKSAIITKEAPIDASNVMVICEACNKATRIAKKEQNGKMVRVCKKCGAVLDKEFVKEAKKETKTATKKTTTRKTTKKSTKEEVAETPVVEATDKE